MLYVAGRTDITLIVIDNLLFLFIHSKLSYLFDLIEFLFYIVTYLLFISSVIEILF